MRFTEALCKCTHSGYVPVIPDFKMISPAAGSLLEGRNVIGAARAIEHAGAPALSVVTESTRFGGSVSLLYQIAENVKIPILRKDFIQTKEDIKESIDMGASAILLICSCMSEKKLCELYHTSLELGIEPLVETHSEAELQLAASLGAELIGINNRDIQTLECDGGNVSTTTALSAAKPKNTFLISESGIRNAEDICIALQSGADAVLIGTAIWKAEEPFEYYREIMKTKVGL